MLPQLYTIYCKHKHTRLVIRSYSSIQSQNQCSYTKNQWALVPGIMTQFFYKENTKILTKTRLSKVYSLDLLSSQLCCCFDTCQYFGGCCAKLPLLLATCPTLKGTVLASQPAAIGLHQPSYQFCPALKGSLLAAGHRSGLCGPTFSNNLSRLLRCCPYSLAVAASLTPAAVTRLAPQACRHLVLDSRPSSRAQPPV